MKKIIHKLLKKCYRLFGIHAVFQKIQHDRKGLNLNIGAGNYEMDGFVSLDFYTPHYYKSRKEFDTNRVHYDMRGEKIPYDDNSVSNIYCSHVIEHIETEFVESFFRESYRVLVNGGCLRTACPDAKFLYDMMMANYEDYFIWHPLFKRAKG